MTELAPLPRKSVLNLDIDLPPEELIKHTSVLIASGLVAQQPSCVAGRAVLSTELEGVAGRGGGRVALPGRRRGREAAAAAPGGPRPRLL